MAKTTRRATAKQVNLLMAVAEGKALARMRRGRPTYVAAIGEYGLATVTADVARLVDKGWIRHRELRGPGDTVPLTLTDAGRSVLPA